MTVVGPEEYRFAELPGRSSADPLAGFPGEASVRVVQIEPVPARSPHIHPHSEEIIYVVSGRGRVWIDGVFRPVSTGSCTRVPAGSAHATLADDGSRLTLVCFFPHPDLSANQEELDELVATDQENDS